MLNSFAYLQTTLLSFLIIWIAAVAYRQFITGEFKLGGFKFSLKNYYIFIAGFAVYPVLRAIQTGSLKPLLIFVFFGFAGMLFEILCSEWWQMFFENRAYSYTVETVDRAYSSWLNIIPWGGGAILYFALIQWVGTEFVSGKNLAVLTSAAIPFYYIFIIAFLSGLVLQMLLWTTFVLQKRHDHKFGKLTWQAFAFWSFPFWTAVAVCAALYGQVFIVLTALFGLVTSIMEYLFGKAAEWIISKKLWAYNYLNFDGGHISPLTLAGFAFAGFYFWTLGLMLEQLVR